MLKVTELQIEDRTQDVSFHHQQLLETEEQYVKINPQNTNFKNYDFVVLFFHIALLTKIEEHAECVISSTFWKNVSQSSVLK